MNTDMNKDTFDFHCPTRMIYRPKGLSLIGKIIHEDYHFRKVYLVYGGHSLVQNGHYAIIVKSLRDNGIDFKEYHGVEKNPDIQDVRKMVSEAKVYQPDLVLACGGGSVLDSAKLLAHGYFYDGDPLDFNKKKALPLHALPVGTILTLAASGSEMSDSCVISDREHNFKGGFNSVTNYPLFSLLDPTLTYTVSPYQTAVGLADMFSHSLERYFSPSHAYEPCDGLALSVMHDIVRVSQGVLSHPEGYEERRAMMLLGSLSHDGFTNYGKKKFFRVHAAEHVLSGYFPDLVHGQGIALLMPIYLEMNKAVFQDKLIRMGKEVFNDKDATADKAIEDLKTWLASLPLAHSLKELGYDLPQEIKEKALKHLSAKA